MSQTDQPGLLLRELIAAEPLPGLRILLYGASDAALAVWMAEAGAELALLDPSRDVALEALRQTNEAGAGRRVRAVETRSTALPMFADFAFDLIVVQAGIPFELAEFARILRPAARLVSAVALDPADAARHFSAVLSHPAPSGLRALLRRRAPLYWSARRLS